MDQLSFVFTIFFMLLGPIKIITAFSNVTRNADEPFRRAVAVRAAVVAAAVVAFVALAGTTLVGKYHLSLDGLRIAGGLVLLLSALNTIFGKVQTHAVAPSNATALQVAISPLTIPIIVPPAGVAAILIFMMLAPDYPGMTLAVGFSLAIMIMLDLMVMYFNRVVIQLPGLMLVLQLLGAVLVFMQVALAIETRLNALRNLGVVQGAGAL